MSDLNPIPVDQELFLAPNTVLVSKSNSEGILGFANDDFIKVSGFSEDEIMGKSMFCVQHPDMPEVIFKMMWEKLLSKNDFKVVVKNLAKNGHFYWTLTLFSVKEDEKGEIVAIYSKRIAANKKSKDFFTKLYKILISIENKKGIDGHKNVMASEKYLIGYLEEIQMDFQGLVSSFYSQTATGQLSESKKTAVKQVTEVHSVKTIQQAPKPKEAKKSLFQRFFGKTEEEIEAEKRRKKK